jgi:hypothetical protein
LDAVATLGVKLYSVSIAMKNIRRKEIKTFIWPVTRITKKIAQTFNKWSIRLRPHGGPPASGLEELDGLAVQEVKQRWLVIGWVTKNLLSRAAPCFRRHVKPLVPAAFAVVRTYQSALGPHDGLWPVLLICYP